MSSTFNFKSPDPLSTTSSRLKSKALKIGIVSLVAYDSLLGFDGGPSSLLGTVTKDGVGIANFNGCGVAGIQLTRVLRRRTGPDDGMDGMVEKMGKMNFTTTIQFNTRPTIRLTYINATDYIELPSRADVQRHFRKRLNCYLFDAPGLMEGFTKVFADSPSQPEADSLRAIQNVQGTRAAHGVIF